MSATDRRHRSREQYRVALDTLNRMQQECQPESACDLQAELVARICSDMASTFAEDVLVRVHLRDSRVITGTCQGHTSQRLLIKKVDSPILLHVPADLVFGQDEEHSPSCVPSE